MLRKNYYAALISLLALFTFVTLFAFRASDDNRLTSWEWVFNAVDAGRVFIILVLGIFISFLLSKNTAPEKRPVLVLFSISFVTSFFFWKGPELIVDSSRYFVQAKYLELYGAGYFFNEWGSGIAAWTDMPVVPFFYGLIFRFAGESRSYIQVFTTLVFSGSAVLTYLIGKELWGEDIGFTGGALLLGIPYLYTQSSLMLVDVPVMFLLTLSIYTSIRAVKYGGYSMITGASIAIFLAFYSKYSAWLMLSVLIPVFLVYIGRPIRDSRIYIGRAVMVSVVSLLLVSILFWLKFDVISEQIGLLLSYQRPGLKRWGESFSSTFLFQTHPFITMSALYSFYIAFKKKDLKYAVISCLAVLVVLMQIRRIRYIIMVFPMLSLMASYGLQEIKNIELKRFVTLSIVAASIVIALFAYLPFLSQNSSINLKEAGELLNAIDASDVDVYTIMDKDPVVNQAVSVPLLDLFTDKRIHYEADEKIRDYNKESPLRFTWEYKNPQYYSAKSPAGKKHAMVVIAGMPDARYPEALRQKALRFNNRAAFCKSEDLFIYQVFVTVHY